MTTVMELLKELVAIRKEYIAKAREFEEESDMGVCATDRHIHIVVGEKPDPVSHEVRADSITRDRHDDDYRYEHSVEIDGIKVFWMDNE